MLSNVLMVFLQYSCKSSSYNRTDTHPQFFASHSALTSQLWTSRLGIKIMQLQGHPSGWYRLQKAVPLLKKKKTFVHLRCRSFCGPRLPSRSSFWKLVPCRERSPPLSTTASSSFLCWTKQCRSTISNSCHACQVRAKLKTYICPPSPPPPSHSRQHPLFRS